MPRRNAMRDNVNAVRSRLPDLSNLSREQIELALLYYESNVDETVDAFNRNGAIEALSGWTEMSNHRGNTSGKRTNNKPLNRDNKPLTTNSSLQTPPSNGILRPSQRVSNIFQTFAEGGTPTTPTNENVTTICSPSSTIIEQSDKQNSVLDLPTPDEINPQRRRSVKTSSSSITQQTKPPPIFNNNKKLLTKSVKDLQRQTSTLTNVELSFNNEIKSSIKRIDDIFKQLREIIKEREVELYLQMDKVKEQGLNVIHRRQQRAVELRQRIDRCDRLEPFEIDNLRTDIKQFVTDRRYDLGEELTSSHRFEYDQSLVDLLKNFGHVLTINRIRSVSTSSALIEANVPTSDKSIINDRTSSISSSSNETVFINNHQEQQPLPQRINKNNKQSNNGVFNAPTNGNITGDFYSLSQMNGHYQYYDDPNNYQNGNRRRAQQYSQGNFQRAHPILNYYNGNNRRNVSKPINGRVNIYNNSETTNTYRRPRPPPHPSQSIVPVQT